MNNFMKRMFSVGLALVMTIGLLCNAAPDFYNVNASGKVTINKKTATLTEGESIQLKIKNTKKTVKWSSSNKNVATVTKKGKVTAKKAGKATITAKVGNKKYTSKITVKAKKVKETNILASRVNKLKSYIKENGYVNGYGDKAIKYTDGEDWVCISYKENTDSLCFFYSDEDSTSVVMLDYMMPMTSIIYVTAIYDGLYESSSNTIISDIRYIRKDNALSILDDPIENDIVNLSLDLACMLWDEMLDEKFDLSLSDFGFTNYKE